ncbi:hypothetical protein M885DRAFT_507705 [Pelagophyceae sp. CCMP2097]|nr:hypothetical protein M885DRAFT_507705 [Pelagophyceae sp. CCMP2097]
MAVSVDADAVPEQERKRARRAISPAALAEHSVESYLTLQRDKLVSEIDGLTAALVADLQQSCDAAKQALRDEFAQAEPQHASFILTLIATAGPHAGATFRLNVSPSQEALIGRSSGKKFRDNGISLPKDDEVSTTHAKIVIDRGELALVDVGSTNGTVFDGEAALESKSYPLTIDSKMIFGESAFDVRSIEPR